MTCNVLQCVLFLLQLEDNTAQKRYGSLFFFVGNKQDKKNQNKQTHFCCLDGQSDIYINQ